MPKIMYVGKKPREVDSKARTGIVWNGNGDIQEVPDWAVSKLVKYADVWKLVEGESVDPLKIIEKSIEQEKEKSDDVWRREVSLRLMDMDKAQLEAFAVEKWNINLDKRRSVENLRSDVNSFIDLYDLPA